MGRAGNTLLELLIEHGLPERGARIYLAACRGGPQTASELARVAALHRVEAYRFIRQLEHEGLLRANGQRPMRFYALPPKDLFDRWIRRSTETLRRLETDREKLLRDWEEHMSNPELSDPRKFTILETRPTVQSFLRRRIGAAEKEVLVSAGGFALAVAIEGGVDRALKEAHERGLAVRIVSELSPHNLAEAKHFVGFSELRHAATPVTSRAVVVDRRGALVFVSGEEGLGTSGEDQVAVWSTSPSFLKLALEYHQRLWRHAMPAAERLVQIESPSKVDLSIVRGHEAEPFRRLREITELGMRTTGLREMSLDLPEFIQTVARQLGRQIAESIGGDTPAEVAQGLVEYYQKNAMGRIELVREDPMVLRVRGCFACTSQSPEIGRVLCPNLLKTVLETRLGEQWDVSAPDPRRHAKNGCVFSLAPS